MPGLIGIGVGPGDVELLTVKAVKAIQNADIIMCPASNEDRPSIAFAVVSPIIDKSKNQKIVKLIFPMTKDKDVLVATWKKNAKIMAETVLTGKNVVYLTVGDPFLYSTWIYMYKDLKENYPDMDISTIPGIVSMFAFAAKVGVSVAEGAEKVAIIPSCYDLKGFQGTHPSIMNEKIEQDKVWSTFFNPANTKKKPFRILLLDFIEKITGYRIGEYKNYILLDIQKDT